MADSHFIQNVPFEYMDVQTLWNDRRDPHASPLSSSPRRMYARAPGPSALGGLVEQIYRPGVGDEGKTSKLPDKRLYAGQK
jgi:hypothetical protein